jgi:hypothetical protein
MDRIRDLFNVENITIRNKARALYKVEIFSNVSLKIVLEYFERYKMLGKKHVVYAVWAELVHMYLTGQHLKLENQNKLKTKVAQIQELNIQFKREKTVLTQNYSDNFNYFINEN